MNTNDPMNYYQDRLAAMHNEVLTDLIWAIQVIMEEYPNGDERFRMAKEIMRKIDPSFRHWSE